MQCKICESKCIFHAEVEDRISGKTVDIYKCTNCGFGQHNKEYTEEELGEMYAEKYAKKIHTRLDRINAKGNSIQFGLKIFVKIFQPSINTKPQGDGLRMLNGRISTIHA